jgi:hypothetical protein
MDRPRPTKISDANLRLHTPDDHSVPDVHVVVTGALVGPTDSQHDRRLITNLDATTYEMIVSHGLFGLMPEIRPDAAGPDEAGRITLELRVATPPPADVGSRPADLKMWVTSLAEAEPHDDQLATTNWFASAVGDPPLETLWSYLREVSIDPDTSMDDAVSAVVEFVRTETTDTAGAVGLEIAGQILTRWVEAGAVDPEQALKIIARDLVPPTPMDGPASELRTAWSVLVVDGVKPVTVDDGRGIVFPVEGENGSWTAIIEQRDTDTVVVYSLVPIELPVDRLLETVEFVIRLNRDLALGTFDLDLDSAEFVVRTGVDVGAMVDPTEAIRRAIHANAELLDEHLPAIRVFVDGATVADSLAVLDI